jgi:hypothetical protein
LIYLLRSFHVKLFRNSHLNIYSRLGESLEEFHLRCIEILKEPCRRELDALQDVFDRLLEQLRQRYLTNEVWGAYDRTRAAAQHRSEFRAAADSIASLFINTGLSLESSPVPAESTGGQGADLAERLVATEREARQAIDKTLNSYREKALSTDEYIIHPNYRDIHLVRTSILWMPEVAR